MLRFFPAAIGLGLATLWVTGLAVDATAWLAWCQGPAAVISLATVGLVPESRSSPLAGLCIGLLAAALFALWIVGLCLHATGWLTWWTLVAAGLTVIVAAAVAVQGRIDSLRTREPI